jgi:hypothetical protein
LANIICNAFPFDRRVALLFQGTRSQGKGGGYDVFSVEPGEIGLTTLERAGDGID